MTSSWQTSTWPCAAASTSGAKPWDEGTVFTLAPLVTSSLAVSKCPPAAAAISGVTPSALQQFGFPCAISAVMARLSSPTTEASKRTCDALFSRIFSCQNVVWPALLSSTSKPRVLPPLPLLLLQLAQLPGSALPMPAGEPLMLRGRVRGGGGHPHDACPKRGPWWARAWVTR